MTLSQLITLCGGRKFVMAASTGMVATLLVWFHRIDPAIYRDILLGVIGLYVAGNTVAAINQRLTRKDSKEPP